MWKLRIGIAIFVILVWYSLPAWSPIIAAVTVALLVLLATLGFGCLAVRPFERHFVWPEGLFFGFASGAGILAFSAFVIGLTTGFSRLWCGISLVIGVSLVTNQGWKSWPCESSVLSLPTWRKAVLFLSILLLSLILLQTLTPPTDYDGLMYHLEAPRTYLKVGRLVPIVEIPQANFPDLVEFLYLFPLALDNDQAPKLIHAFFGLAGAWLTFHMGRRWSERDEGGWFALAAYLATPLLLAEASQAYVDLAWGYFTLLGLYAWFRWFITPWREWLILAGIGLGLAAATKYLALVTWLSLVVTLFFVQNKRRALFASVSVWATAALVAAPWYVRNWFWFRNPFYPFIFGGPEWDAFRLERYAYFNSIVGYQKDVINLLLLPFHLYAHSSWFGELPFGFPSLLALFVFLNLWGKRHRLVVAALAVAGFHFIFWAMTAQFLRLLSNIYPLVAVLSGTGLVQCWEHLKTRWTAKTFIEWLAVGAVSASASLYVIWFPPTTALAYLLGTQSRTEYLTAQLGAHLDVWRFVPPGAVVFVVGYGIRYYAPSDIVVYPDATHDNWPRLLHTVGDRNPEKVAHYLCRQGFTHLLISWPDVALIVHYDRRAQNRTAEEISLLYQMRAFTVPVYLVPDVLELRRLTCP